jgi:hypothetical protein
MHDENFETIVLRARFIWAPGDGDHPTAHSEQARTGEEGTRYSEVKFAVPQCGRRNQAW